MDYGKGMDLDEHVPTRMVQNRLTRDSNPIRNRKLKDQRSDGVRVYRKLIILKRRLRI